jgi:hypothetical protein
MGRRCAMKKLLLFAVSLVFCTPALAGVRYTLHLEADDAGKHTEIVQNSWLQGDKAKLFFDEGVNAESEVDADHFGAVAYHVDPVSGRSTRIFMGKHEGKLPVVIDNVVTTKTLEEAGPVILGHPTTHYRFTSAFDYTENGFTLKGTMTHELWVASDLAELDLMNWIMFEYRLREDHGVESLFREVSTLGRGIPLAYDGLALIQNGDGNTRVVHLGASVEALEKVNIDPSVFSATDTYEVVATVGGK